MGLDSPDRFKDVIHVAAVGQQQRLAHPDGRLTDLLVAFELLEAIAIGFQPLGAEETLEAARVDRLVEQAVVILFVIAAAGRDAFGADLVSLWTETEDADFCGLARAMSTVSSDFEAKAFSVVERSCATGNYSFGHELAHNMGAKHDRDNTSGAGSYPYSYGYRDSNSAKEWRTMLAYCERDSDNNCVNWGPRIPYFSNPNVNYNGTPTGRPAGTSDSADNAQTLNNTAFTVANFRQTKVFTGPNILTPTPGTTLYKLTVTFTGGHTAGQEHWIQVGTSMEGAGILFDLF